MKKLLLLITLITSLSLFSQYNVDTVITNEAYSAYVNKELGQALYVKYKLYKGGGKCQRPTNWINDTKLKLVNENQYKGTLYDKGHLANAEDFAYDSYKEALTFSYFNCFPQNRKLNRGVWNIWETTIRQESQKWPLRIYCGGIYTNPINSHSIGIPSYC